MTKTPQFYILIVQKYTDFSSQKFRPQTPHLFKIGNLSIF